LQTTLLHLNISKNTINTDKQIINAQGIGNFIYYIILIYYVMTYDINLKQFGLEILPGKCNLEYFDFTYNIILWT